MDDISFKLAINELNIINSPFDIINNMSREVFRQNHRILFFVTDLLMLMSAYASVTKSSEE